MEKREKVLTIAILVIFIVIMIAIGVVLLNNSLNDEDKMLVGFLLLTSSSCTQCTLASLFGEDERDENFNIIGISKANLGQMALGFGVIFCIPLFYLLAR